MKSQKMMWMAMLASFYAVAAYAESASGTITSIDPSGQNVTLRRADTNALMTVHVKDKEAFSGLTNGREVTLNANRIGAGWEARSLEVASDVPAASISGSNIIDRNTSAANSAVTSVNDGVQPDNSAMNARDRSGRSLTPMDQSQDPGDLKITQEIRKLLMDDGSLSANAKNVKVITEGGVVTIRGPVNSQMEKNAIEARVRQIIADRTLNNLVEVKAIANKS